MTHRAASIVGTNSNPSSEEDPDGEIENSGKTFLKSNPELLLHSSYSF